MCFIKKKEKEEPYMIMKKNEETKKSNNIINGKRGFTLVEICVVLMLVSIITVMVVSFTVLVGNHSRNQLSDFEFLEDFTDLKAEINAWVREYDTAGANFFISEGRLSVSLDDGSEEIFDVKSELEEIKSLSFELSESTKMIKCNVYKDSEQSGDAPLSCSFAIRIAEISASEQPEEGQNQ